MVSGRDNKVLPSLRGDGPSRLAGRCLKEIFTGKPEKSLTALATRRPPSKRGGPPCSEAGSVRRSGHEDLKDGEEGGHKQGQVGPQSPRVEGPHEKEGDGGEPPSRDGRSSARARLLSRAEGRAQADEEKEARGEGNEAPDKGLGREEPFGGKGRRGRTKGVAPKATVARARRVMDR